MTFFAFGLNHEKAPVAMRERFALAPGQMDALFGELEQLPEAAELVVLSTCNRTEAYLFGTEVDVRSVKQAFEKVVGESWPAASTFEEYDEAAVLHILRVACGLRSLVLGDAQILAQMKDAYRRADEAGRVGTVMHRLMHSAFRTAKRVASETGVSAGAASVSSMAVTMVREYMERSGRPGLRGAKVVVLGAGQMGRLAVQSLSQSQLGRVVLINRSEEKAREAAGSLQAEVAPWERRSEEISDADIVIVTTGSTEPVVAAADVADAARPIVFVDISVPRNVDRSVDALPHCRVFDLDTLNTGIVAVESARRAEVPAAEEICDDVLVEFVSWVFHQQALQPAIQAIRDTFDEIRMEEIERHVHRFSEADRDTLMRLTQSIMQKLLAVPIVRLKSFDPESIDFVRGVRILNTLFSRPGCDQARQTGQPEELPQPGRCQHAPEEEKLPLTFDDLASLTSIRGEA
jgi:glutamyl-tRNA reductase